MKWFGWFRKDDVRVITPAANVRKNGKLLDYDERIALATSKERRIFQCNGQIAKLQNRVMSGLFDGSTMTDMRKSIKAIKKTRSQFEAELEQLKD